jgi:hypothetical protein
MQQSAKQSGNNIYWNLEKRLTEVLKPVRPNPEFVDTLKSKLTRTPAVILEKGKKRIGLVIVGLGLITGTFVFWIYRKLKG